MSERIREASDTTMSIKTIGFFAALILILTACSKQGDTEHGSGADGTSGVETNGIDNAAGSHPAELNASPGEGGLGTGATGVEPNNLANPPAPDTSGGGASGAATGGGAGTGGSTGSAQ